MSSTLRKALNHLVRSYLYHVPLTEGKSRLLRITKTIIEPEEQEVLFRTKYGFKMSLSLINPEHAHIYYFGEHDERYEIRHLRKILRQRDVVWDIGANVGFYTCLFAQSIGSSGSVVSFEPAALTRRRLEANVRINAFENVRVLPFAIGSSERDAVLWTRDPLLCPGTASVLNEAPSKGYGGEAIQVKSIDSLSAGLPTPALVKIDVEGLQLEVLMGGLNLFRTTKPIIFAEVAHDAPAVKRQIHQITEELNLTAFEFHKRCLRRLNSIRQSNKRNLLLCDSSSDHFDRVKQLLRS